MAYARTATAQPWVETLPTSELKMKLWTHHPDSFNVDDPALHIDPTKMKILELRRTLISVPGSVTVATKAGQDNAVPLVLHDGSQTDLPCRRGDTKMLP